MKSLPFLIAIGLPFFIQASPLTCTDSLQLLAENSALSDNEAMDAFNKLLKPLNRVEMEQIKKRLQNEGALSLALEGRMQAASVSQAVLKLQNAAGESWPLLRRKIIKTLNVLINRSARSEESREHVRNDRKSIGMPVKKQELGVLYTYLSALSSDGRYLATQDDNRNGVQIRDLSIGKIIRNIDTRHFNFVIHDLVFSGDSQFFAIVGENTHIYKGRRFKEYKTIDVGLRIGGPSAEFSKDNERILLRDVDESLEYSTNRSADSGIITVLKGRAWYRPDGSIFYVNYQVDVSPRIFPWEDKIDHATVRNAESDETVAKYSGEFNYETRTKNSAISKDGQWLATGGKGSGPFTVWKNGQDKPYFKKSFGKDVKLKIRFSPDDSLIAIGIGKRNGVLFDIASKKIVAPIPVTGIDSIRFSADAKTMFVTGDRYVTINVPQWMAQQ